MNRTATILRKILECELSVARAQAVRAWIGNLGLLAAIAYLVARTVKLLQ